MDAYEAHTYISSKLTVDAGRFFTKGVDLPLGVGKIFSSVRYPVYIQESQIYQTLEGLVYILSHECDIDPANQRTFNDHLLICPILDFQKFIEEYQKQYTEDQLKSFLSHLAEHKISRVVYLPHIPDCLPFGGILYLNQVTNTHVSEFSQNRVSEVGTVTAPGLMVIDYSLLNHFLRPKSVSLPLEKR